MRYTYKNLLQAQNILSNIETMQPDINLLIVNTILGYINNLLSLFLTRKETVGLLF